MSELIIADMDDFVTVADAIRATGAASGELSFPDGFVNAVNNMAGSSSGNAVLYTAQTLTDEQKAQARANIDCGSVGSTENVEATGACSHAEGGYTTAEGFRSHAEGSDTMAFGTCSHAEGSGAIAAGNHSHAEGAGTVAVGECSHAEGVDTAAAGNYSHAEGSSTAAEGDCSHAEGDCTEAVGDCSHVEGSDTMAEGISSHAEGDSTLAKGDCSHAEGSDTMAEGISSHAEGSSTAAVGISSHAEGNSTIAYGKSSHAEGDRASFSVAINNAAANATTYTLSIADSKIRTGQVICYNGTYAKITNYNSSIPSITVDKTLSSDVFNSAYVDIYTSASGDYSHTEGANTMASGESSHAEGSWTEAIGISSHAEGFSTVAEGDGSHAEGVGTIATYMAQHVQGYYNIADDKYAHIVGNGVDATGRSNAHTLTWGGVPWFAGDRIMLGGTGMDDENAVALMPPLVVNITETPPGSMEFTADKTASEIYDAFLDGKPVIGNFMGGRFCYLTFLDNSSAIFASTYVIDGRIFEETLTIHSDSSITYDSMQGSFVPVASEYDNGKTLMVVDGVWTAVDIDTIADAVLSKITNAAEVAM